MSLQITLTTCVNLVFQPATLCLLLNLSLTVTLSVCHFDCLPNCLPTCLHPRRIPRPWAPPALPAASSHPNSSHLNTHLLFHFSFYTCIYLGIKVCPIYNCYINVIKLLLDQHDSACSSAGWSVGCLACRVGQLVCNNFLKNAGKLHFHPPIIGKFVSILSIYLSIHLSMRIYIAGKTFYLCMC